MNIFPLSAFLDSLTTDGLYSSFRDYERVTLALRAGGTWTITRFRDVLLALLTYQPDHLEIFNRRFKTFFSKKLEGEEAFKQIDLKRALDELRALAEGHFDSIKKSTNREENNKKTIFETALNIKTKVDESTKDTINRSAFVGSWTFKTNRAPKEITEDKQFNDNVINEEVKREQLSEREISENIVPKWIITGKRHFSFKSIGGRPGPIFKDEELSYISDSLGYFQNEEISRFLNIDLSVKETVYRGGIPTLKFYKKRQMRTLLILEDDSAVQIYWNPIAKELAKGMLQRGVPVLHGNFTDSIQQFKTEHGSVRLGGLENNRNGYLLLIFTDGKTLYSHKNNLTLEILARWPMVAWMELKEPCFWDNATKYPIRYGLPVYPATPDGVMNAMKRFLTEYGTEEEFSFYNVSWQGIPSQAGKRFDAYIEILLGDAFPWAQECALLQPVSQALADTLRQRFHPYLPPQCIGRLLALPGTMKSISGMRFSNEVLKVLRTSFVNRLEEDKKDEVLQFIFEKVKEVEPNEKECLAHLAWEVVMQRMRLEFDEDCDLLRLIQLMNTPLNHYISMELGNYGYFGQKDKIPLRIKTKNLYAFQRLAQIQNQENPRLEALAARKKDWEPLEDIEFVYIEPGDFIMGSGQNDDEIIHKVTITKGFYMQSTQITQGQWCSVMGYNPSRFKDRENICPVENVSWDQVQEFIWMLNHLEKTDLYRLPTEAEWEYVCRAGTETDFSFGNSLSPEQANCAGANPLQLKVDHKGIFRMRTMPVRSFPPNAWGLYDMHGNVWEWCQDWLGPYPSSHVIDPMGSSTGTRKVYRGGSWYSLPARCRSAARNTYNIRYRIDTVGFRLCKSI